LPETKDKEGKKVTISVESTLPTSIKFSEADSKLILTAPEVGTYTINLKLTDEDGKTADEKMRIVVTQMAAEHKEEIKFVLE
jgi:hypothetical protein